MSDKITIKGFKNKKPYDIEITLSKDFGNGPVLYVLNGVTGYESYFLNSIGNTKDLFYICLGNDHYSELYTTKEEMQKAIDFCWDLYSQQQAQGFVSKIIINDEIATYKNIKLKCNDFIISSVYITESGKAYKVNNTITPSGLYGQLSYTIVEHEYEVLDD